MATTTKTKATAKRRTNDGPTPEQKIVETLVAIMEAGTSPWQRPWHKHRAIRHTNIVTGKAYSGCNPALLEFQMMGRNSDLPLWAGFAQAKAKGWLPKKGSKGCYAIRPQLNSREELGDDGKPVVNDAGETTIRSWVSYKPVCLFNVLDLEGEGLQDAINALIGSIPEVDEFKVSADAERVLGDWHRTTECKLSHGGDRAFYSPSGDRIQLPVREQFKSAQGFYATWAHEIVHSTGHGLRLKRDGICGNHPFGSVEYAREELVAELGAFLITSRLGIGCEIEHHASYLNSWIDAMKDDPKYLFKVMAEANRAANLVISDTTSEE